MVRPLLPRPMLVLAIALLATALAAATSARADVVKLPTKTVKRIVVHPFGHKARHAPLAPRRHLPKAFAAITKVALGSAGATEAVCCTDDPFVSGAAGNPQKVQVDAFKMTVFNRSGTLLKSAGWESFCPNNSAIGEARVLWDPLTSRWFSLYTNPNSYVTCLSVSATSDATGAWYAYPVPVVTGGQLVRPVLGMDDDAILFTYDVGRGAGYIQTGLLGVSKSRMMFNHGGLPASGYTGLLGHPVAPVVLDNLRDGDYLAGLSDDHQSLLLYRSVGLQRAGSVLTLLPSVGIVPYTPPPAAALPGSAGTVQTGDGWFPGPSTQIGGRLVNVHGEDVGGHPGVRWYEFDTDSRTIVGTGLARESTTSDDFSPSIAASTSHAPATDPVGDLFLSWASTDTRAATVANRHPQRMMIGTFIPGVDAGPIAGKAVKTGAAFTGQGAPTTTWGPSSVVLDPVSHAGCPDGSWAFALGPYGVTPQLWGGWMQHFSTC